MQQGSSKSRLTTAFIFLWLRGPVHLQSAAASAPEREGGGEEWKQKIKTVTEKESKKKKKTRGAVAGRNKEHKGGKERETLVVGTA